MSDDLSAKSHKSKTLLSPHLFCLFWLYLLWTPVFLNAQELDPETFLKKGSADSADQDGESTADTSETEDAEADANAYAKVAEKRDRLVQNIERLQDTAKSHPKAASFLSQIRILEQITIVLDQKLLTMKKSNLPIEFSAWDVLGSVSKEQFGESTSYVRLETLREQLQSISDLKEEIDEEHLSIVASLHQSMETLEEKNRERRLLKDQNDEKSIDKYQLAELLLEIELAKETSSLNRLEKNIANRAKEAIEKEYERLSEEIELLKPKATFGPNDLKHFLDETSQYSESIKRKLEKSREKSDVVKRLAAARSFNTDDLRREKLLELSEQTVALRLAILTKTLRSTVLRRGIWQSRYDVHTAEQEEIADLIDIRDHQQNLLDDLKRNELFFRSKISELRKAFVALEKELMSSNFELSTFRVANRSLKDTFGAYDTYIAENTKTKRLISRFLEDIDLKRDVVSISQNAEIIWNKFKTAWMHEVTEVDDKPITVGKIFSAFFLFLFGVFISRRSSRQINKRVLAKFGVAQGSASAFESLFFYALVISFALVSLRLVQVPLTIFTFLGGAVAIGIGFGSQNIVNNFISGIILLIERPVRVGDLIELQQLAGVVQTIGLRSTVVRTSSNIDIIVPNASFLQEDVINWTLSDNLVRLSIKVGIAYGSDIELCEQMLRRAAAEHPKAVNHRSPLVWFTDFGNNSLDFELHFWAVVRDITEKFTIESELRVLIHDLFAENGLVIAFPQRDVHLQSSTPVRVEVVQGK